MELVIDPGGHASWRGRAYRCAIGRGGIVTDKAEGDGGTPAGCYSLSGLLYRPDRIAPPRSRLPVAPLWPDDGWCDSPGDARYNGWVRLPYPARCERLWRDDEVYDLIGVTTYNTDPVLDGAGSAIFVHVARPGFLPTEGCIAFAIKDLLRICAEFGPEDSIRVEARASA